MFRLIQTLLVKVSHLQRYGQQSGHFFVKRRGLVFMACLHRVKYLCMRPPTCMLFVCTCKHEYALRRSGLSYCKKKKEKEKKYAMFDLFGHGRLAHSMSWMVVVQFGLQIPSFTWSAACNSNWVSHIAPPHLQTHPLSCSLSLLLLFFLSECYIICGCFWLKLQSAGGGVAVKLRRRGKKEEPGHVWPRGQLWFYEMRAEARTQVDNVKLGFAACLSFNTGL